jgi:hypothetical protein
MLAHMHTCYCSVEKQLQATPAGNPRPAVVHLRRPAAWSAPATKTVFLVTFAVASPLGGESRFAAHRNRLLQQNLPTTDTRWATTSESEGGAEFGQPQAAGKATATQSALIGSTVTNRVR